MSKCIHGNVPPPPPLDPYAAKTAELIQTAITKHQDLRIEMTIRKGEVVELLFTIPDPEHRPQLP